MLVYTMIYSGLLVFQQKNNVVLPIFRNGTEQFQKILHNYCMGWDEHLATNFAWLLH